MPRAAKLSKFTRRFAERVAAGEVPTKVVRDLKPHLRRPDDAAHGLMRSPKIAALIEKLNENALATAGITRVKIVKELGRIAFVDPRKLLQQDGSLKAIEELDDDSAAAIAGLDVEELFEGRGEDRQQVGVVRKVKIWNKREALSELAAIAGMKREQLQSVIPTGPGLTVIVQQGGQVNVQQNAYAATERVAVDLPKPE